MTDEKQRLSNQHWARNPFMGVPALSLDSGTMLVVGTRCAREYAANEANLETAAMAIRKMALS